MTTKKKVIIALSVIAAIILCIFIFVLVMAYSIVSVLPKFEERESGDFVVLFYEDHCEISGTTEQGNKKKYLVIPSQIEGYEVTIFGVSLLLGMNNPDIHSDALERVYFESAIKTGYKPFDECPNLKKIFYPEADDSSYRMGDGNIYHPRSKFDAEYGKDANSTFVKRANVSYYYNYEREDGEAYYWIDDYDYGCVIEFVPPAPEREGYEFGGWYTEPECVTAWDFESDTLPEEQTTTNENGEEETVYQETILYAKWTAA